MAKFKFYQDIKVTIWQRTPFYIEADSKEKAVELAKLYADKDVLNEISSGYIGDIENMWETAEIMSPQENDNQDTIEICDEKSQVLITNYEPIGYQLLTPADLHNAIPDSLYSWQIFKTEEDARKWAKQNNIDFDEGWEIVEIYPHEIERYVYIKV